MTLFWLMLGLSLAIGGIAWHVSGVDAVLLIMLHPVMWALIILGIAGVVQIERERDRAGDEAGD